MIKIQGTTRSIDQVVSGSYALVLPENFASMAGFKLFARSVCPELAAMLKANAFSGKVGQVATVSTVHNKKVTHIICAGLGSRSGKKPLSVEQYRRAVGRIIKCACQCKADSLAMVLPRGESFGVDDFYIAQQTAIIANMANYHFDEFLTDDDAKGKLKELVLCYEADSATATKKGIKEGEIIGTSVNKARHWVDMPPTLLTPPQLADYAQKIAKKHKLGFTSFNEKQIIAMGMGGLAGVSRGSLLECRLAILEYNGGGAKAPKLAFIGKGITFDSGGLSIKPAVHMETMKEDMSGAAAVIAAMEAIAQLKPKMNVVAVVALAENLPGGNALKPGDIVQFYNGKTAEVRNTDAEGRLVLADALSYAVKHYKPDMMIDLATLTGACAYALGPYYSGLMSRHDHVVGNVECAAECSGDFVWRLPMTDDYKSAIRSQVADICNIGTEKIMAGAITAAHFLEHFVGDTPWAHLDIAGTAFNVPNLPYYRPGATGVGVRLLVELARSWKSK